MVLGAAGSARADVVDLDGETISKTGAEFKAAYNNNTIENGTVNVSAFAENTGTYTIGVDALVQCREQQYFNGDFTINIERGGEYRQTGSFFEMPFRFGLDVLTIDGGKFTSTAPADGPANGGVVNFGYVWNNKDSSKNKDISATVVMKNDAELSISAGNLQLGSRKSDNEKGTPVKTVKTDFFVTNSTVKCEAGDINLGYTTSKYISDLGNSYINVVFGPGSHIHFRQMYVQPYPAPSVVFDGATIHKVPGGYSSFIGHNPALGDIYTIDEGGLTIDIPSDVALTCDQNASSLKGAGGITKIGEGSNTWNQVSSGGSPGMTFTGPLVVSNGTWTSSLSYAASAFKVDGSSSTLALSGALSAADVAFEATDGGTLTLAGATITDATPDMTLAGGGKTDYFTRDGAVDAYTLGTLTLGEDVVLGLDGDSTGVDTISATALALSATAANKVTISFSDAANVLGGTHDLVTVTGGGTFATGDLAKFALDENLPEGSVLSLSEDLTRLVLTVPATNPATWTGGANDNNLLSPMNWLGKVVPGSDADVIISVDSATTLTCDDAFAVNSISFTSASAQVTISGSGCITNATEIVNASEARPVINVPVEFVANDAYTAIDVTGEVDFSGGVKGTVPANHSTFYGNYTLTAGKWNLSSAITLAANATVTASDTTIETSGAGLLNAEAGSILTLNRLNLNVGGNIFGTFAGNLTVNYIYQYSHGGVTFNSGFSGVLRVNGIHHHSGSSAQNFTFAPTSSATIIFGGGSCGIEMQRGGFDVNGYVFHSSGDWEFDITDSNYAGENGAGRVVIGSNGIVVDTSDYDDSAAPGHTVSVNNTATKSTNALTGSGGVTATGNGTFKFNKQGKFTGGFTANESVTLTVNSGVYPGKGDVTIADTATFNLAQSGTGTVPVSGTLTMSGGTTLRMSTLASGVLPLSVNALAFDGVTAQSKVKLEINDGTLANGYYAILKSATTLPADAVEVFVLDVNEAVELPAGAETSLVAQGDTLFLQVGDVSDLPSGVWVGGVDTDMSNRLNWKNWTVPAAGSDLDFSGVSSAATVNADIDAAFGAVTMGTGVVTFTGALTATSFSDTSKVAVGADSTVTLDDDLVFTSGECYITRKVGDGGAFVVTGTIRATGSADVRPYETASAGWIVAKGLENAETSDDKWNFRLNYSNVAKWVVGEDGIAGTQYFWSFNDGASDTTIKADADFTIATWLSAGTTKGKGITFDTSGWTDSSTNYTITADCGFVGVKPLTVKGDGTFICNYTPTKIDNHSAYSGAVTVKDTATLAINAGKVPTTGAVTVNAGAALQVAQSGTVALGGGLTLDNGAVLAFNYTGRAEPVLDLEKKTVTFEEGETTNVTVRISADAGARAHGGKNVLTTGGKFADATVTLAEGAPNWASGVAVEKGEIVLSVKPVGLAVFVR